MASAEQLRPLGEVFLRRSYKRQKRNPGVTEIKKIAGRGHALTIDGGWQDVAQTALDFVKRFV